MHFLPHTHKKKREKNKWNQFKSITKIFNHMIYCWTRRTWGLLSCVAIGMLPNLQSTIKDWTELSWIMIFSVSFSITLSSSAPSTHSWISALMHSWFSCIKFHAGKFFLGIIKSPSSSFKLGQKSPIPSPRYIILFFPSLVTEHLILSRIIPFHWLNKQKIRFRTCSNNKYTQKTCMTY